MPQYSISHIRYFTSVIKAPLGNHDAVTRQKNYLQALQAFRPGITVHLGHIRSDTKTYRRVPLEFDEFGNPALVRVQKLEEKGTYVSIASFMVLDAPKAPKNLHLLISSDGDFAPTLEILANVLNVSVGIVAIGKHTSKHLMRVKPLLMRQLRVTALMNSQLPEVVIDGTLTIKRPEKWS